MRRAHSGQDWGEEVDRLLFPFGSVLTMNQGLYGYYLSYIPLRADITGRIFLFLKKVLTAARWEWGGGEDEKLKILRTNW